MDNFRLFDALLHAESEDEVESILKGGGYLTDDPRIWHPLGGMENNFGAVGNQQSDATGALVEKIINAIDSMLMAECFAHNIDPESPQAPQSMTEAVELFFKVRDGKIDNLGTDEQRKLAENINLVAVGSRTNPNYLIIDKGEGQTPAKFPDTFLSLLKANKIRIPFVQGKFNSGGTGVLQFCGTQNYQLIVSKRRPNCPVDPGDQTANLWGFTLVRRLLPSGGRRNSMYVYLAPGGQVPSFQAEVIKVLPGESGKNQPAPPYAVDLPYGTCIKLYNYRWRAKTLATTDALYELERFLQLPCLPFRLTETRDYSAHYYATTVRGGWASATAEKDEGESKKLEEGFPAYADLTLAGIGKLPYRIAVYKEGIDSKHVSHGIFFVMNGQTHGSLPSNFVSQRLKFDYLTGKRGPLLVLVDCTAMNERVREDFFMASRDRVRHNEVYNMIEERLADDLKNHPGLQEINQRRRKEELEKHLDEEAPLDVFQKLLQADPTLSSLFAVGDRLVTSTGPGIPPPFIGRKFPTFFRLVKNPKGGLIKDCPINRTCRVEFETDAMNDYFSRVNDPGEIIIDPPDLCEHSRLWNGQFQTRFRVPWDAQPGTEIMVTVTVTDVTRVNPFISTFTLKALPETSDGPHSGPPPKPQAVDSIGARTRGVLAPPKPREVRKEEWESYDPPFSKYEALRVMNDSEGGFDYFVNIDNAFLIDELAHAKEEEKQRIKRWFTWGLVLAAVGMLKHHERLEKNKSASNGKHAEEEEEVIDKLEMVRRSCSGLAQVIIPIIRTLNSSIID